VARSETLIVTLLLADAEGSGSIWVDEPALMHQMIELHSAVFTSAVEGQGGTVFDVGGDSFWAAFSNPSSAVAAALAAQRKLKATSEESQLPLRARMAIYTGPARWDGRFYSGPTAARTLALLETGYRARILTSEATLKALSHKLPFDVNYHRLGSHRLLNSGDRELVFELRAPDLDSERAMRIVATILFTDIVDSTSRAVEVGDERWRDQLTQHHMLLRRTLAAFNGREIRSTGDGVCAVFTSPANGIECACAMANAIGRLGMDIRVGLHTGECEEVGEDSIHGLAVHIAARVAALAGTGEVVVSSTVRDLVAGSGIVFVDLGLFALKGVPGEWRLFSIDCHRD
jgi:class 3 adenylate cyclase